MGAFAEAAAELRIEGTRFVFGGTPPVAAQARSIGFFERAFDGSEPDEAVLAYLKGQAQQPGTADEYPQTTVARIAWKAPFPLLRHHFGLPTLEATRQGIARIAEAQALDVISLGIDQDAQANFFHPERQDRRRTGAGGVPVRSADDYRALYAASRRGNMPLLRTYSGTDDFIRLAELYVDTINIAWCAIPLFWFNQMDGRSPWDLAGSIREHQQVMAWYGRHDIPIELNEPHHWGMRDAPDVVFVVAAYLAAYNARACGVRDYIAQLMFNSPPGHSDAMDLAKMLACLELIGELEGPDFRIWRQTRTGLLSYPLDGTAARAHLAASVYLQMALRPHIIHVVGHTEAHHAATADDVIEACGLARRAITNARRGQPDMTADPAIQRRKNELVHEAEITLDAIAALATPAAPDPLTDPTILARAVATGILDAPQLRNNERQRMEWHPDEPNAKYRILLGLLGNEARDAQHNDDQAFAPITADQVPGAPQSHPRSSDFIYGFNALLYGQGAAPWQDRGRVLTLSKNAGIAWIRQQVRWTDLQSASGTTCYSICWGELDQIVDDSAAAGVKLLLSMVAAPNGHAGYGRGPLRAVRDRSARSRVWHHAGQCAAARAALLHPGRGHHAHQD